MRREFLFNILFLITINIVIKPFYTFFIETEVQNIVGPQAYGIYFSLFNLSYIFQIFLDLGLHNFGSQYLAKDNKNADDYLSKALTTKGYLTLVFALLILIVGWLLGYDAEMNVILWLVSINQIFISFIFFFRSSLAALGRYRTNSFISVLDKIIMISAFTYVLFISADFRDDFSIYHFIGIRMLTYLFTTFISLFLLVKIGQVKIGWLLDINAAKSLIKQSLPFAILVVFMGLCNRTDAVMLERLLDDEGLQSGMYAAAYRIYYAMNTLGFLFSMLLLPMFSSLIVSDKIELFNLVDLSLKGILALSIGAIGLLFPFREVIMETLYKTDAAIYGTDILILLCLTFILTCIIYILGTLLTAYAKLKYLNYVFVIATVLNIGINLYLIPIYGATGAAWATLVTEIIVVVAQFILCYYIVPLRLSSSTIVSIFLFSITILSSSLMVDHYISNMLSKFLLLIFVIGISSIGTRMIDLKNIDLRALMSSK